MNSVREIQKNELPERQNKKQFLYTDRNKVHGRDRDGKNNTREKAQKDRIVRYWTLRSDSFAKQREAELESELHDRWLKLIRSELPDGKLSILDVGTGSGFFAILLSMEGHQVTGIDLTESMIDNAKKLARQCGCDTSFEVMDAENLNYMSESFDVVISRNLTWTLPNPVKAYREWMRVLKPGGILLNYDADYGAACFTGPEEELPREHAHHQIERNLMQECENLKQELDISTKRRPEWDVSVMKLLGCQEICTRRDISEQIYLEKDEFYNPVPLFSLKVVKK
ncbi:MAG: class I SAM-dependent methyltransferase [Lachnospiraceae bacterium]|nr:class I SAM-dependent methyltransferase [Lachnospiraceae bacterium]